MYARGKIPAACVDPLAPRMLRAQLCTGDLVVAWTISSFLPAHVENSAGASEVGSCKVATRCVGHGRVSTRVTGGQRISDLAAPFHRVAARRPSARHLSPRRYYVQ